jgi:hypothetical protein
MIETQFVALSTLTEGLADCFVWTTLMALAAGGLWLGLTSVWHRAPGAFRGPRQALARHRQAVRGIAEIEAFLSRPSGETR